jgi:hypothetical protein
MILSNDKYQNATTIRAIIHTRSRLSHAVRSTPIRTSYQECDKQPLTVSQANTHSRQPFKRLS